MPRIIKPEVAADLSELFIPQEPRLLSPDSISAELMLTQALLTGTHKFRGIALTTINGAANGLTVNSLAVPADRYWYVHSCHLMSQATDVVLHNAAIQLAPFSNVGSVLVTTKGVARLINDPTRGLYVERPFLMPPLSLIQGIIFEAPTLGTFLQFQFSFVEHRILDPHPTL